MSELLLGLFTNSVNASCPPPAPPPPAAAEPLLIQFTADVPVALAFDCLLTGQRGGANYNLSCCREIYALNLHSHSDLLARM